jgi:hypothetical protein
MKKTIKILAGLLIIISCSKESNNTIPKTTKQLLVANDWLMHSYVMLPGIIDPDSKDTITDIYANTANCDKDDFFAFKVNDSLIYNEGKEFCKPTDIQEFIGTYSINSNYSFTTKFPNDTIIYTIISIDENSLMVSYENILQNRKQVNTIKYLKK